MGHRRALGRRAETTPHLELWQLQLIDLDEAKYTDGLDGQCCRAHLHQEHERRGRQHVDADLVHHEHQRRARRIAKHREHHIGFAPHSAARGMRLTAVQ